MAEATLDIVELGEYVKRKRQEEKLSLRQVAQNVNVSASTLSRIENGIGTPDSATLARLAAWLGIPLERLMKGSLLGEAGEGGRSGVFMEAVVYYPTESTPNIVEAHLRADRSLKPEMAKALAELFRVAYGQYSTMQTDRHE
ncbi:MAG TPA: helix-turn-helix transcriptional regulator [Blastocatellia bacterium]|jgi:transcriptional regulator with XRE-family HTH domain|nr:helix-turn-helix transcriptional regulator [Blastocatellia bacterium]